MKLSNFFVSIVFFCLFTVSATAGELKKISFLPMWSPQAQSAAYYLAKEKGIYEKYGLDVKILTDKQKRDVPEILGKGEAHFGIMNLLTAINENANGMKFVNIAQIFQKSSLEFVVRKEAGINSLTDFNGKKIAVWKTLYKEQINGFLKKYNIEATIYPVNNGVDLFFKKAVEICAVMHYNEYNTLINYGINPEELKVFKLSKLGMDFPEDGIYCTSDTYKNDPMLCKAFVDASIEGWEYALKNPAEALNVIKKIGLNTTIHSNKAHMEWMMACMQTIIISGKDIPMGHLQASDYENALNFILPDNNNEPKVTYGEFYRGTR